MRAFHTASDRRSGGAARPPHRAGGRAAGHRLRPARSRSRRGGRRAAAGAGRAGDAAAPDRGGADDRRAGAGPHRVGDVPAAHPAGDTSIPRYGAVNLHPAPPPRGRGPNPTRPIYDRDLAVAGALHRLEPAFDAGAVLAQCERRLHEAVTVEGIRIDWMELLTAALVEGAARAVAGDPGTPQDDAEATCAAPFTEAERWLSWDEPALTIRRRAAALNALAPTAHARLGGEVVAVLRVAARPGAAPTARLARCSRGAGTSSQSGWRMARST